MSESKLRKVIHNWRDVSWWRDSAIPYGTAKLTRAYFNRRPPDGTDIMAEDWDNLLILDGCRYDVFEEHNTINGELWKRTSHGSSTPEFLKGNFKDQTFHDTVYVTANPQVNIRLDQPFHALINVWEEAWDHSYHTVPPEPMMEVTKRAYHEYPDKRIIAHFIQPHYPFIGPKGQELADHAGAELSYRQVQGKEPNRDAPTIWDLLKDGDVTKEQVWEAYVDNLKITLPHVERLLRLFDETTVVTSDHGNLFGEFVWPLPFRRYGHPRETYTKKLVEVPWLIVEGSTRKTIAAESPVEITEDAPTEEISNRLADLGYLP